MIPQTSPADENFSFHHLSLWRLYVKSWLFKYDSFMYIIPFVIFKQHGKYFAKYLETILRHKSRIN